MPFNVEPVSDTCIDVSSASKDDRLAIWFENRQVIVFKFYRHRLLCDIDRSSEDIIFKISHFFWKPQSRKRWSQNKALSLEEVRKEMVLWLPGDRPVVTIGGRLIVRGDFLEKSIQLQVAEGSKITTISSYVPGDLIASSFKP